MSWRSSHTSRRESSSSCGSCTAPAWEMPWSLPQVTCLTSHSSPRQVQSSHVLSMRQPLRLLLQ